MTSRKALWGLIAVAAVARLLWAGLLGAGNDEAYHALYTQHFDWSFYDHPPMMAVLAALGRIGEPHFGAIFPLRVMFVLLFAGSMFLIARLTERSYGPRAGWLAAFLLSIAGYYPVAAGSFVLPDGPLLFFWLLTLERFQAALQSHASRRGGIRPWVQVGLAWGCALLSKYHGVMLPGVLGLTLIGIPQARVWIRRPGPYLALVIGMVVFSPVIGWNAAHGWASLGFQAGRAVPGSMIPRPDRLLLGVAAQAAYLTPWIWFAVITALVTGLRAWKNSTAGTWDRFWLAQPLIPLGLFSVVGLWRMLLPHWSLVGLLPMIPLAAAELARQFERSAESRRRVQTRMVRWACFLLVAMVVVLMQFQFGLLGRGFNSRLQALAVTLDPTAELYGWSDVARELENRHLLEDPNAFLFTSRWYHSGQLAFALGDRHPVLCYSPRMSQGFSVWSRPEQWVGHDGILVVLNDNPVEVQMYQRWFESIEPLGEFDIDRAGTAVKHVRLYRCKNQTQPFPFNGVRSRPAGGTLAPQAIAARETVQK